MTIKAIREAKGREELIIRGVQLAVAEVFETADLDTSMVWNVLVNMLCGLSVKHEVSKDDVMEAVSSVYDLQFLALSNLHGDKPN
jgi:hypothetical protein